MNTEAEILKSGRVIATVGLSPKTDRPSHRVAAYLQKQGYRIIPVNPAAEKILGEKSYPSLDAVPSGLVDTVQIFRRPSETPPLVDKAVSIGARAIWMQEGVINEEAATAARTRGLKVVMDRCMMKEHKKLADSE